MADDGPAVQTYAIVPHAKWKAMEQRLQRAESEANSEVQTQPATQEPHSEGLPADSLSNPPSMNEGSEKKKDVKLKYRKVQMKKLLHHMERLEGSQGVTSLENIDDLIKSALGSSKKILPNESKFFTFLFDNSLTHFVKNRWKIGLYYNMENVRSGITGKYGHLR